MTPSSKLRMSNKCQVGMQQFGKNKNKIDQDMGLWIFFVISPILYPCSAQPKDIC
jgi:hypothetical protein